MLRRPTDGAKSKKSNTDTSNKTNNNVDNNAERDDDGTQDDDRTSAVEDVSTTSVDAFDDEDAFRDDDDDEDASFRADTRTVDRSTAATSGVLLSCERCSHHGTCALGGDCQCAAMFEGKACRITRALGGDPAETKRTASGPDPVLSGFARGFGGSMTLTRENAPAKLEARQVRGQSSNTVTVGVVPKPPVELEPASGTRDFYPDEMRLQRWAPYSCTSLSDKHAVLITTRRRAGWRHRHRLHRLAENAGRTASRNRRQGRRASQI